MSLFTDKTTVKYRAEMPEIYFTIQDDNSLRLHWGGNSTPCYTIDELKREVEKLIGKGSFLKRTKDGEYAKDWKGNNIVGTIGFGHDYLKSRVIEAAYHAAVAARWEIQTIPFFRLFNEIHQPDCSCCETKPSTALSFLNH